MEPQGTAAWVCPTNLKPKLKLGSSRILDPTQLCDNNTSSNNTGVNYNNNSCGYWGLVQVRHV